MDSTNKLRSFSPMYGFNLHSILDLSTIHILVRFKIM